MRVAKLATVTLYNQILFTFQTLLFSLHQIYKAT